MVLFRNQTLSFVILTHILHVALTRSSIPYLYGAHTPESAAENTHYVKGQGSRQQIVGMALGARGQHKESNGWPHS